MSKAQNRHYKSHSYPRYILVEINSYMPAAVATTYLVEGSGDRWIAMVTAVEHHRTQYVYGELQCINSIMARETSPDHHKDAVLIKE